MSWLDNLFGGKNSSKALKKIEESEIPIIGKPDTWNKPEETEIPIIGRMATEEDKLQHSFSKEQAFHSKRMEEIRNERKKEEQALKGLLFVIDGAKLECRLCTNPQGVLKVNLDAPSIQNKRTATVAEKDASSLIFTGNCTQSPNSASPCASVMSLGEWKNTGSLKIQDETPLLFKSTVVCNYGGAEIKITDCAQRNEPKNLDTQCMLMPVPSYIKPTGGISTRFYDEQGQQIYEIPQKLHKAFNEEYGIKIAYDKENEMLYYEGDCAPAYEKTSPTAIEHWKRELNPATTSKGKLLFGVNFGYKITSNYTEWKEPVPDNKDTILPVFLGDCPYVPSHRKHSIACIDLGDYDDNLQPLGVSYRLALDDKRYDIYNLEKPKFSNRYMGLVRALEHEFIGHVILNYFDDRKILPPGNKIKITESENEIMLGNKVRKEIDLPDRQSSQFYRNNDGEFIYQAHFGYYEGSDESEPDIYVYPMAPDPAPAKPILEGIVKIKGSEVLKIAKINYTITIKYKYNEKNFDFI